MIDYLSRSKFVEKDHNIHVLDVAPAVDQDLREWRGTNSGRGCEHELSSVQLDGLFNRVNRIGGVLTISENAYAKAEPELKGLIEMVLDRKLPFPFPLAYHRGSTLFLGELIVEGYRRTRPLMHKEYLP